MPRPIVMSVSVCNYSAWSARWYVPGWLRPRACRNPTMNACVMRWAWPVCMCFVCLARGAIFMSMPRVSCRCGHGCSNTSTTGSAVRRLPNRNCCIATKPCPRRAGVVSSCAVNCWPKRSACWDRPPSMASGARRISAKAWTCSRPRQGAQVHAGQCLPVEIRPHAREEQASPGGSPPLPPNFRCRLRQHPPLGTNSHSILITH